MNFFGIAREEEEVAWGEGLVVLALELAGDDGDNGKSIVGRF